ncbi:MAG: AAA family ATPase [Pseudomonadota bacterium]
MPTVPRHTLPPPANIIVLNGTSSSGKSSLARALQARRGRPIQHLQLDAFRRMEPNDYWEAWNEQDPVLVALKHAALCRAMHAALSEYVRHGIDVIFDTVLWHREDWRYLLEDLDGLPVYLVGVNCALEELSRREQDRGDREIGLAAGQFKTIHMGKVYDFQVDTTEASTEQCAGDVLAWLDTRPEPRAFRAVQASFGIALKLDSGKLIENDMPLARIRDLC